MSNIPWWVAVGLFFSLIGLVPVAILWIDRVKKKSPELIDRAMKMVEVAGGEADEMRAEFVTAQNTIKNLNFQLVEANNQIVSLNRQLSEAKDEVVYLKTQVRMMTQRMEKENNGY